MKVLVLCLAAVIINGCASGRSGDGLKVEQLPAPVSAEAAELTIEVQGKQRYAVRGYPYSPDQLSALLEEQDRVTPLNYVLIRGGTLQDLVFIAGMGKRLGFIILYENEGLKTLQLR